MRKLEKAHKAYFCQKASGPFSYLSFFGKRVSVLIWKFSDDGEFITVEVPSDRYTNQVIEHRTKAISELKAALNKLLDNVSDMDTAQIRELTKSIASINI